MFNRLTDLSDRAVLRILIGIALVSSGVSFLVNIINQVDTSPAWWVGWLQNFSTEMFGAFLTFIFVELIVGRRQRREDEIKAEYLQREAEQKQTQQLKQRLIIQMRSQNNAIALQGLEEFKAQRWLYDGSLRGEHLWGANLQGASVWGADLQGAIIERVDLQQADLSGANLQRAKLERVHLQYAILRGVDLHGAILVNVDLGEADLERVDLDGTHFDENTTLPDGSRWTPGTDMKRFTDPEHTQFWRPKPNEIGMFPSWYKPEEPAQ